MVKQQKSKVAINARKNPSDFWCPRNSKGISMTSHLMSPIFELPHLNWWFKW